MSDFTPSQSYGPKDSLITGDPEKLILGTDFDIELLAIAVAIATKYDSTDLASQVQAEAGSSLTTLITPGRLSNWADFGAGTLTDIRNLADPNADRVLFWDDSAGGVAYLTMGSGLILSGTTLSVDFPTVDITTLLGYDPNKYVDHTLVSITAGEGLTGGGTIAATRTLSMAVNGLTEITSIDPAADFFLVYDVSASLHKKVLANNFVGFELGDGKWKLSSAQSLSAGTEATALLATAVYDSLTRGTFSTGTYTYTATLTTRVLVIANALISSVNNGHTAYIAIQHNGINVAYAFDQNSNDGTSRDIALHTSTVVSMAATDTIRMRAQCSNTESMSAAAYDTFMCIIELA